ncbi:Uncharacterised protein [[Clostridium] sordellii]|uniref:hypothetical protein n=1 Tax=Paraclostridium sordellii TaxID=1505 RepID=UPI0005DBC39F|nr:hypothetical protein [Paeniclostridium sordellii]CEN84198.1 Uncharacterised protein [[Clostridium] sordellii] [Paeniclostridium sordellii]CEO04840.1 Uncharacterised protein [[Clostridium] sordellii] [Paeniclostridium sordellii]CEO09585.1 Uncharacterised protein [[Clostridium] sordellii] [Paeniclostridium sordellii]
MIYLGLIALFFICLILFSVFIDRFILSNIGFKNIIGPTFLLGSLSVFFTLLLACLDKAFPFLFGKSILLVLLVYHSMSFFVLTGIFIFFSFLIFFIDAIIKSKLKKYKFSIFTCSNYSYLNLLKSKRFLTISLGVAYFLSAVVILFPIPNMILDLIGTNKDLANHVSSEIETYKKLFIFSSIPIPFTLIKRK